VLQTSIELTWPLCGDAHLSNFGIFADFDETLPGPFEWDVKRLAASFAVAGHPSCGGRGGEGIVDLQSIIESPAPAGRLLRIVPRRPGPPRPAFYRHDLPMRGRVQMMLLTATALPLLVALAENGALGPSRASIRVPRSWLTHAARLQLFGVPAIQAETQQRTIRV